MIVYNHKLKLKKGRMGFSCLAHIWWHISIVMQTMFANPGLLNSLYRGIQSASSGRIKGNRFGGRDKSNLPFSIIESHSFYKYSTPERHEMYSCTNLLMEIVEILNSKLYFS